MRNDVKSLLQKINQAGIPYRVFESDSPSDEDVATPASDDSVVTIAAVPAATPLKIEPAKPVEVSPEPAPEPQFKGLFRHYAAGGEPPAAAEVDASPKLADIFAEMRRQNRS